jgi:DNA-binding transcriptional regulator LsrR (DeoR family)
MLVGQADNRSFTMPLTQEVLADFLGLSIVHVNRTLQQLRRERLIEISSAHVVLLDTVQLAVIADYQPHLLDGA